MHDIFQQLEQLRHLPALDQEVCQAALSHMAQGLSRTLSLALPHMTARVFEEVHTPPATLIIVGASHVAIARQHPS
jgi:hypothetical protein